ncbi:hypothetical protein OG906_42620 (plasmid) [Streptomyces sp. NBC_01426]|uniref:hypothetical protein n=1 Tax=Streptomyces sp. NBC_01426 TaxID=2975866 RepID=UPI002E2F67D7|nr:hypothetical protein [Streptomyces sp. NBC_01426]
MVPSSLAVVHGVACQAKRIDYGERKSQIGSLNPANSRFLLFQELGFEAGDALVSETEVGSGAFEPFLQRPVFPGQQWR